MGRKKIKIARIQDDRNRSVTYLKRKAGLMKKAHELAVLTSSDVAVIVFGQNGKLSEFCSGDIDQLLLRYTEHTGPVERKGPENYQNDDDDGGSDDDNMDEGDDDSGDAGASGPSSGQRRGAQGGARGSNHKPSGSNGSNFAGGADGGMSRASKRKAARDADEGHGRNSKSRDTSPAVGAPIIKVEGDSDENVFTEGPDAEKAALRAALAQNAVRKPRSNSHHGGRSQMRVHGYKHQHSRSEQNILTTAAFASFDATQRPNSADVMKGPNAFVFPPPQSQKQDSSSPFAMPQDMNQQQQNFLGPQMWQAMATSGASPISPQNASLHPNDAMSYGDLARGGNNGGAAMSPMSSQHLQAPSLTPQSLSPSPLPSPEMQALGHSNAFGNVNNLLPLAHPALRDHPQYEAYAARLRQQQQQQQQSMHQRNASMPAFPSNMQLTSGNNFLAAPGASPMNAPSPAVSAPPLSPAHSVLSMDHGANDRRSTSFGGGIENAASPAGSAGGRFMHQSSVSDIGPITSSTFLNPFSAEQRDDASAAGHYAPSRPSSVLSSHSHHSMQQQQQPQQSFQQDNFSGQSGMDDYGALGGTANSSIVSMSGAPPPPYASAHANDNHDNAGQEGMQQDNSEAHLSNAAFNDLMGSILSDMNSGHVQSEAHNNAVGSGGSNYAASAMQQQFGGVGGHSGASSAATLVSSSSSAPNSASLVSPVSGAPGSNDQQHHDLKTHQYIAAGGNPNPTATGNFRPYVDGASSGAEF